MDFTNNQQTAATEPISGDASQIVWDTPDPVTGDTSQIIWDPPAPARKFDPTLVRKRIHQAAAHNDPLLVFGDPGTPAYRELAAGTSLFPDPDAERRKLALAAYFAGRNAADITACYNNIDEFCRAFNGGKTQSPDAAWSEIAGFFAPRQPDSTLQNLGSTIGGGAAKVAASILSLGIRTIEGVAISAATGPKAMKAIERGGEATEKQLAGGYRDISNDLRNNLNIPQDWVFNSKSPADFARNAFYSVLFEAPSMALQVAVATANPAMSLVYMGASSGNDKYSELLEANHDMDGRIQFLNAVATGIINGTLEKVTVGLLNARGLKLDNDTLKAGFKAAAKYYLKSFATEGATEGFEQIAENAADILSGARGDLATIALEGRIFKELLAGAPESVFVGGVYGDTFALLGHHSLRDRERDRVQLVSKLEAERDTILNKDMPDDNDYAKLDVINHALDADDNNTLYSTAILIDSILNRNPDHENAIPAPDPGYAVDDDIDSDIIAEARSAELAQQANRALVHNPDDTARAIDRFREIFPAFNIHAVPSAAALPDECRQRIQNQHLNPDAVNGYTDDNGNVWVVTANVAPSSVPKVIGHEIIGHHGLAAVFGKTYSDFLDGVYRDHASDIYSIASAYNVEFDNAESSVGGRSLDEKARYLTEEWLADIADADVKPHWWNGLLSSIRMMIRKIPGFRNIRFSNAEIESAIKRSARAMRKRATDGNGQQRTTTDGETRTGETSRFALDSEGNFFPAPDEWGTAFTHYSGKGLDAIEFLLQQQSGFVPAAFHRQDIGDIDVVYGKIGSGVRDKGGFGLAHILKRHPNIIWENVVDAIQNGELNILDNGKGIISSDDGKVILRINKKGRNWVISAFFNASTEELSAVNRAKGLPANLNPKGIGTIDDIWPNVKDISGENEKKFRFSIAGERGAARMHDAEARMANLQTARNMLDSGMDMAKIKLATGWEKGGDGKWRTETNDDKAVMKFMDDSFESGKTRLFSGYLHDFIDDPELFAAYPELKNYDTCFADGIDGWGIFEPENKRIILRAVPPEDWDGIGKDYVLGDQKQTLRHEIQHAIQQIEGFARGGAAENIPGRLWPENTPANKLKIAEVNREIERLTKEAAANAEREHSVYGKGWTDNPEYKAVYDQIEKLEEKRTRLENYRAVLGYRNLAGEVEARNAASRELKYGYEYRIKTLLADTEDVAENDKIYLQQAAGAAQMATRVFDDNKQIKEGIKLFNFLQKYEIPLRAFQNGTLKKDAQFELGETPDALTILGVDPLNVAMSGNLFFKAQEKHGLSIAELRQIPTALYNPVMIFDSSDRSTNPDGMVVLTQIRDSNNQPVIIALNLGKKQQKHIVNDIASIHPRDARQFIRWIEDGFLRYSNKKRALAFARFHRLQLPKKATISERHSNIIIDHSQDVKPYSNENHEISRNVENREQRTDTDGANIRFALKLNDPAEHNRAVAVLRPFIGHFLRVSDEEIMQFLQQRNFQCASLQQAHALAVEALKLNEARARKKADQIRDRWLYDNVPLWRFLVDYTGSTDFKVKPSARLQSKELKGTWIAKPKEKKYHLSDVLAMAYAKEHGGDPLQIEQQIIDFLADLTKPVFYKQYYDFKKESATLDNELDEQARKEYNAWKALQEFEAIRDGHPDPQQQAMKNQQSGNDNTDPFDKFRAALASLRQELLADKVDTIKLQRMADDTARQHLPPELRGVFTRKIINLATFSNRKTPAYPDGHRLEQFRKIIADIIQLSNQNRREHAMDRIAKRLNQLGERVDASRKVRGLRDTATQSILNRIIEISRMDAGSIDMEIAAIQNKIEAALTQGENTAQLNYDIALLNRYGVMWEKSADDIENALKELEAIAKTGKDNLLAEIQKRAAEDEADRNELWMAVNGMKRLDPVERKIIEDKRARRWKIINKIDSEFWSGLSLDGLFEACAFFAPGDKKNVLDKFREMAHVAKREKDTLNRNNASDCSAKISELLHVKGSVKLAGVIAQWRTLQEKSGVFRFVPDPDQKQFDYRRLSPDDARSLLAQFDAGKNVLSDFEAEAIRHQLRTIDLKVKYDVPKEFRDGATDRLLKLVLEESAKSETPEIVVPIPANRGASRELPLSQMQALYLKLMWEQPDIRYKMHFNGYSEETIAQIDKFILPEVKQFGDWMRSQLELDRDAIDKTYQALYYTMFPHEQNYFPSVYDPARNSINGSAVDLNEPGAAAQAHAYTPGALKVRVYHLKEPRIADALTVFQNHRMLMNHFVTHAECARKMRAILLNPEVKYAIEAEHGKNIYAEIKNALEDFINGGNKDVDIHSLYAHFYSSAVRAKMAHNFTSGGKQTLGFITYIQEIPPSELFGSMAYGLAHPGEVINAFAGTDYIKNRWDSGGNADLRLLLDASGRSAGQINGFFAHLDRFGSIPLRIGDAVASVLGGFAVYRYHFEKLKNRGLSPAEARKEALLKAEMATERTQQSSAPFMLNKYQRGSWALRSVTTFMSNQILLWNHIAPRVYKAAHYQKTAPIKGAAKGLSALILSSAAMTAFDQLKDHWRDGEYEWWDYLMNLLADGVCGSGPTGWLASQLVSAMKPGGYGRGSNIILGDIVRSGYSIGKLSDGNTDLSDNDCKAAVDILTILGYFMNPVAHAAAAGREARKWHRIFFGD